MFIGLLSLIAVAFVEFLLSASWAPAYFRFGFPLFEKQFAFSDQPARQLRDRELSAEFRGRLGPSIVGLGASTVFRRLSQDELAFRKRFFEFLIFATTPIMHGIARVDRRERTVTVTGYANWYPLFFSAFWLGVPTRFALAAYGVRAAIVCGLMLPTVLGVCWFLELPQYRRVYRRLQEHYGVL